MQDETRWVRVSEWVPSIKNGLYLSDDLSCIEKRFGRTEYQRRLKEKNGKRDRQWAIFARYFDAKRLGLLPDELRED